MKTRIARNTGSTAGTVSRTGRALQTVAVLFLLVQSGCTTVGPNFSGVSPPAVRAEYLGRRGMGMADTYGLSHWWHQFNDPTLVSLLHRAEQSNFTLDEAMSRILESRARLGIAGANFAPDIDFNETYRFTKRADNADPFVAQNANAFNLLSVGFDAGWEIDLFGRLSRQREAAAFAMEATEYDRADIRITLLAEVASVYVQIRSFQEQIQVSRSNLAIQQQSITLVQEREAAGVSTKLDSEQAIAFKFRTEANTHQLEQQLRVALNQLSVLLGSVPTNEIERIVGYGAIPVPTAIGIGIPANLLRMRPDVRRAEAEAAVASAQIGVAVSDLYPQLEILGNISLNTKSISELFTTGSLAFSVGPSLSWNVLQFGRIRFNIEAQREVLNQRIAAYRETVIQAVREVEDGLAQNAGEIRRAAALQQAMQHDQSAVNLSADRYRFGKANYQRVLDSQQQQLQDTLNFTQARANAAIQMIRVYKAVGGGQGAVGQAPIFAGPGMPGDYQQGCFVSTTANVPSHIVVSNSWDTMQAPAQHAVQQVPKPAPRKPAPRKPAPRKLVLKESPVARPATSTIRYVPSPTNAPASTVGHDSTPTGATENQGFGAVRRPEKNSPDSPRGAVWWF